MGFFEIVEVIIQWLKDIGATNFIALYAAILSTFVLGWNVWIELSKKGRLKIHCYIYDEKVIDTIKKLGISDVNKENLNFKITNIGEEPVILTQLGGIVIIHV